MKIINHHHCLCINCVVMVIIISIKYFIVRCCSLFSVHRYPLIAEPPQGTWKRRRVPFQIEQVVMCITQLYPRRPTLGLGRLAEM